MKPRVVSTQGHLDEARVASVLRDERKRDDRIWDIPAVTYKLSKAQHRSALGKCIEDS